jgi:3-hydroxypropanoate dehydrogenase
MSAPATAIVGYDLKFRDTRRRAGPERLHRKPGGRGRPSRKPLQGAYLIMAARALGLDCGPMSGFDNAGVDKEFFAGTDTRSNFLCNLGYGDPTGLRPRAPRFAFGEMAQIV